MGVFAWIGRKKAGGGSKLDEWRRQWRGAASAPTAADVAALSAALAALGLPEDDIEIEREMLEGLDQLATMRSAPGLPIVETGHRVVGTDVCHFTAPASMPDDAAQPSGRLILTSARAIFAGGARSVTMPWHAAARILQQDRDLVIVRRDETLYRFRCNAFADAMAAAFLAETLASRHRR